MSDQETTESEAAEQRAMLRESAADFVRRSTDMKKYRERRQQLPGFDAAQVKQMAGMGWFGILVPEAYGGLGLGHGELAVVLEELGKGLLAEPLVATTVLAGRLIAACGQEALKAQLLPALAEGSALPALAWQEGQGALDPAAIETRSRASAQGVVLDGRKRLVAGAGAASGFVVSALSEAGLGLYWVPSHAKGLSLSHEWRPDGTPVGVLQLDSVLVPPDHLLMPPGAAALGLLEKVIDEAAVMAGAEMLGVMAAALQMTLAYMRTRVQFGKPIGSFQVLQHKAADLYVQQELTRAVLAEAVVALGQQGDARERALIASRCKSRCSDAGLRVTREAIQLHGAIGFTDEYDVGLYLKRALVLSAWLGNASAHRRRFAALMQDSLAV